ncbi:MAG: indole-3-glycerol phosphate synthase TrpC [Verrucomicrobia bacterium]|nr:indole-3-glycerol phosphate synthase TrpC [Verrucomicrobiota bacterium]
MKIESTILSRIAQRVRQEVATQIKQAPLSEIQRRIHDAPPVRAFDAVLRPEFGLIAEVKRRSPSMGEMRARNVAEAPSAYAESSMVKAVSVLTNASDFGMCLEQLSEIRAHVGKPVLRKDFIIDAYQIYQARAYGADAVLLMTQLLSAADLETFLALIHELGMHALVECRSRDDIAKAPAGTRIYGINSRDFLDKGDRFEKSVDNQKRFGNKEDFTTDLSAFDNIPLLPKSPLKVAESGISPETVCSVREKGYNAALVGTDLLMNEGGVRAALQAFEHALQGKR